MDLIDIIMHFCCQLSKLCFAAIIAEDPPGGLYETFTYSVTIFLSSFACSFEEHTKAMLTQVACKQSLQVKKQKKEEKAFSNFILFKEK